MKMDNLVFAFSVMDMWLIFASFLTSTLTAVFGIGGGVLLIGLMVGTMPATAIVPVHGLVQLSSNLSRACFGLKSIRWDLLRRFLPGVCAGTFLGSQFVLSVNIEYIPAIIGVFILLITWMPELPTGRLPGKFFSIGTSHGVFSTLAGAAGPISAAFLAREGLRKEVLVATIAAFMTSSHLLKVIAFTTLGFDFMAWLPLMLAMSISVILGSWAGVRMRPLIPDISFNKVFRWLITLLAIRMLILSI